MSKPTFCALPRCGAIRFSGKEAQAFLNNQLTCDVVALAPASSTYGAYCTPKGRMLASFLLWRSGQDFYMQLPTALCGPVQKQLSKFILRAKVTAVDVSSDWKWIGVAGDDSVTLVRQVTGQAPRLKHEVGLAAGAMVICLPGNCLQVVAANDSAPSILEALSAGAEETDPEYWEWLEIQSGIPTILPETQEAFVPQMLNFDLIGGVSFEKGCYPGQEIVARMHYRGTLKQRMCLANIPGTERPEPGDKLYSNHFGDQACGTIVNAARSPGGGFDTLAVIQIASTETGDIRWKSPDGILLNLLPLPYGVPAQV